MAQRSSLLLLTTALAACSTGTLEETPCESNAACRASFGFNAVCADDGLCRVEPPAPRCDRTQPADLYQRPESYVDALVIGNLMDRTEPKKVARERAAQLATAQVDEVGGLAGRTIAMVLCSIEPNYEGDGLDLEEASTRTAHYLSEVVGVPAIVGPSSSSNTLAVFEELQGSGTLLISPAATSPELSGADPADVSDEHPGLLWRTAPSDSAQGPKIAEDMVARDVQSVAAIVQDGSYGDGLYQVFVESLDGRIPVELYSYSLPVEQTDAVSAVSIGSAEEVLFISSESSDISAFLETAFEDGGFDNKSLFLTDAAASADVLSTADPSLFARLRGTRPKPLDESELVYKNLINGYRAAYGEDVTQYSFTAHAYDAAWLVFYGSAWALHNQGGRIDGVGIARGLRQVSQGDPFQVKATTWLDIVDSFAAGQSVDVQGSSGDLDFDPTSEETAGEIELWVAVDTPNGAEVRPAP